MSLEKATLLADEIVIKRKEYLRSKIKRYPASNFRASNIPECDRQMVYSVLNWKEKSLYDEGLQAIFDRGNTEEKRVKIDLMELDFNFVAGQNDFEIKNREGEVICRGHIDGKIIYREEAIPCEIKSMNMNTFNALTSLDSFHKKPLHRKYLRQMQLYLFGNSEEAGLFILTDLQGHYKIFVVELDYGTCEYILQRLERNWVSVKKKEYPDRITYSEQVCEWCPYSHICLPDIQSKPAELINNKELEEKLDRRAEIKAIAEDYRALDGEIKAPFKKAENLTAFVGTRWQVISKTSVSQRIDTKLIPEKIAKDYLVDSKRTNVKIIDLNTVR